ncbi:MAG: hypothetical protein NTX49_05470 [Chlamydiae bacterium]|nr:hypothetical protein [Chlamydiota bacterium]
MIRLNWIALLSSVFLVAFTQAEEDSKGFASSLKGKSLRLSKENKVGYQAPVKTSFLNAEGMSIQDGELFLTYEPDEIPVTDVESIKKRWTMILAESIGKARLEELVKEAFINYDVYTDDLHFSPSFVSLQLSYQLKEEAQILDYLEEQLQVLLTERIPHDEFVEVRSLSLGFVLELLKDDKTEDEYFSYCYFEKEYLQDNPAIPFAEFIQASSEIIRHIRLDEVTYALFSYFEPRNKILETISPADLEEDEEEILSSNLLEMLSTSENKNERGFAVLKRGLMDQNSASIEQYNQLRLTDSDKKSIKKILTTMADNNVFQLLLEKKSLEKKGKQIRPVHPLRFLGYICADSHLRKCLHSISKNHFKWSSFVDGFKDRMKEESKKGQLLPYVPGFSSQINANPVVVEDFINKGDYEGLMKHFI